jgi:hypothetical protein
MGVYLNLAIQAATEAEETQTAPADACPTVQDSELLEAPEPLSPEIEAAVRKAAIHYEALPGEFEEALEAARNDPEVASHYLRLAAELDAMASKVYCSGAKSFARPSSTFTVSVTVTCGLVPTDTYQTG